MMDKHGVDQELIDWIQHDLSDFAQRVREAIAPPMRELARLFSTPMPVFALDHRHMMRRKINRMVRNDQTKTSDPQAPPARSAQTAAGD